MWETIREYLTFTRKERYGVLFLLILIIILFVLPYFFQPRPGDPDPEAYEKMKDGILKAEAGLADSGRSADMHDRKENNNTRHPKIYQGDEMISGHSDMFYFDPNIIGENKWHQLGLREHLIQTIQRYVQKGGRFHNAEDLKKLYGLRDADYQRLYPYVRISKKPEPDTNRKNKDSFFRMGYLTVNTGLRRKTKMPVITDINQADSASWSMLPGIGAKLASRIIHFREKLGGFYQVNQVGETYGLADSSFQEIKPFLKLKNVSLTHIDLNAATKEILQSHPYIRWQIAVEIINYRQQHGNFHSVGDLLQLAQMDSMRFEKLRPYLVLTSDGR
jgi:competence protein ComEA